MKIMKWLYYANLELILIFEMILFVVVLFYTINYLNPDYEAKFDVFLIKPN